MLPILLSLTAAAESWCAAPLTVHEWGVAVFSGDGRPLAGPPLPDWFHTTAGGPAHEAVPVAELPADSGIRTLPVLQFYAPRVWGGDIPLAVDVGFAQGTPAVWYPQVDRATDAELFWRRLDLTRQAPEVLPADTVGWVSPLRAVEDALWVSRGAESDRYLFYEGTTRESPAVTITPGENGDRHYILRNTTDWDVHDVFVVHVEDGQRSLWYTPKVPGGKTASCLRNPRSDDPADLLRSRDVTPRPAEGWSMRDGECAMMRDPAVPVAQATDHRLYAEELAVLLSVWEDRFFTEQGSRILYREDTAALDALVPLALYTDMHHYIETSRLGLVLVEGVGL